MSIEQTIALITLSAQLLVLVLGIIWGAFIYPKLQANQKALSTVQQVAGSVVPMVEQTVGTLSGPEKKAAAIQTVSKILTSLGMKADPALIDAAIEASVYMMNAGITAVKSWQKEEPMPGSIQPPNPAA